MGCATKLTSHSNYYFNVSSVSNLCLIVKLLMQNAIFDNQPGKKNNKSEVNNLYFGGTKSITMKDLLNLYQYKIYKN